MPEWQLLTFPSDFMIIPQRVKSEPPHASLFDLFTVDRVSKQGQAVCLMSAPLQE